MKTKAKGKDKGKGPQIFNLDATANFLSEHFHTENIKEAKDF